MKLSIAHSPLAVVRASTSVVLVVLFLCSACSKQQSADPAAGTPTGRAEETWSFWESFNQAAVSGTGAEVLPLFDPEMSEKVAPAVLFAVLDDIIAGERSRNQAITSLPVLDVDPDLATYAVAYSKSKADRANALLDYVALMREQERITSEPVLGVGLLLNLLNHSDDKEDGILWRAMLDQGRQTTSGLQSLKARSKAVEAKFTSIRNSLSHLSADEMALRSKLSQRFGREFPPLATYVSAAAAVKPKPSLLSEQEIAQSLLGRKVGVPFNTWTFEDYREFVSLEIVNVGNRSDTLADYEVQTHVKGIRTGNERNFRLQLTYFWFCTRWALVELKEIR